MKILTIGNSFTWSLSEFFPSVTESAGDELTLQFANHGGCELHRHWEYITNEERDEVYRMYDGKRMRELLAAEKWDVVTVQQASRHSGFYETYEPYLTNLLTIWMVGFLFSGIVVVCILSLVWQSAAVFLAGICSAGIPTG